MLDFDKKTLYSQFPEPFGFENYIPKDWQGKYMSFIENIKDEDKYWIYKNRNLLIQNKNDLSQLYIENVFKNFYINKSKAVT